VKIVYLAKDKIYVNENGRVVRKDFGFEKGVVTSALKYKYIFNITFKLPKNLDKDMLEIEAEKYIFTEGSLDYTKDYKINFFFKEYEDFYNVEAFIVDMEVLKREYEEYLKTYKFIDFITLKPFVFEAYYDISKLPKKRDVFIFFNEEDAFLSCFVDGEFIFVKSLNKLETLAKELNLSLKDTVSLLQEKGLDVQNYEEKVQFEIVESFFSQFFMKVNHLLSYASSYYKVDNIERMFFYSPFNIKGLFEKYKEFWNLSGVEFREYKVKTDYDSFDYTAVVYNSKHYKNEKENFSIFPRPIPFYKTHSGILIILILAVGLGGAVDAFFKYYTMLEQEEYIAKLRNQLSHRKKQIQTLKALINKYDKQIALLESKNRKLKSEIEDISKKIDYLHSIQMKKLSANELADLAFELKKYHLKLLSFKKEKSHIKVSIISDFDNSADVAKFMQGMYKRGYKNVNLAKIENFNGIYISEVSYDE